MNIIGLLKKTIIHAKNVVSRYFNQQHRYDFLDSYSGWKKIGAKPVFGDDVLGVMFDPFVFKDHDGLKMVVSSRRNNCLLLAFSADGIYWKNERVILTGRSGKWDEVVNRGCLVKINNRYFLWYTGQGGGGSFIGLASSDDGISFARLSDDPVMVADKAFEGASVMNPHVIWDENACLFKMWYSAGENYEPDVICYAESLDGIFWRKRENPVLSKLSRHKWECYKVGGCFVEKVRDDLYVMYYIGYQNLDVARICTAYSYDGIVWNRKEKNLLLSPSRNSWDSDAVYKPSVITDGSKRYLWYNGRKARREFIGLAVKSNFDDA